MENPIKMDDLGVPLFLETPIWLCYVASLLSTKKCVFVVVEQPAPSKTELHRMDWLRFLDFGLSSIFGIFVEEDR